MGYVPGVDRFVSDLAHYVSSADLARNLLVESLDRRSLAYAWGWATHVLADILIHPLVGRACGEILYGSRELRLNSGAHIGTHVAVEVGLDATILQSRPDVPTPPRRPRLGAEETGTLSRALGEAYDLDWDPGALRSAHIRATQVTWRWPRALRFVTRSWPGETGEPGHWAARLRTRATRSLLLLASRIPETDSSAYGLMRPLRPAPWFLASVREVLETFPERFQELVDSGLESLENHNLENGIPERSGVQHPMALQTRLRLRGLWGAGAAQPRLATET
jgi:hypothetical protein